MLVSLKGARTLLGRETPEVRKILVDQRKLPTEKQMDTKVQMVWRRRLARLVEPIPYRYPLHNAVQTTVNGPRAQKPHLSS
jgi:hypothetical protein